MSNKTAFEIVTASQVSLVEQEAHQVEFALWVRTLRQNGRQGTVACKGRSDVARTNKKPWKQKGTGRARAGSARSPLWRGGGVTFGPMARVRTLKVSQKVKHRVLNALLWDLLKNENVLCLDWQLADAPKTSAAFGALKQAKIDKQSVVLLVQPDDIMTQASWVNIPGVSLVLFDQVNAVDLCQSDKVVVLKKDLDTFKQMVSQWI